MRDVGILTTATRMATKWGRKKASELLSSIDRDLDAEFNPDISGTMLGLAAAGEAPFLQRFVNLADADRTTYG